MAKESDKTEKQILLEMSEKLNALIQLQAAGLTKGKNIRDSIEILDAAGLKVAQISGLLGKKPKFIYKELGIIKKRSK